MPNVCEREVRGMKFHAVLDPNESEVTNFDVAKAVINFCNEYSFEKPNAGRLDPTTVSKLILLQEESIHGN